MRFQSRHLLAVLLLILMTGTTAQAAPKYLFKIASIAPDGSVWARRFNDFVDEVAKKSNGAIGFKVYAGGVMGDDQAMLRKMQIGQLDGGGFTMTGVGGVVPDFRVMGIPFLFRSYDEVDRVRNGLLPYFRKAFAAKGLELVAMTEVGFVYSMSTSPITTLPELKKSKCWAPEGDPVSSTFLQTIGITPIPLSIPDVLTSLQTGMVDTVFNSLYGSIVLQWFTKANYISDTPFGYAYGALLINKRKYDRLPPEFRSMLQSSADKNFALLIEDTRKSNAEARQALQQNNVTFTVPAPDEISQLYAKRDEAVRLLESDAFSTAIYQKTIQLLDAARAGQTPPASPR